MEICPSRTDYDTMSSHWIDDHGAHLLVGGEVATASQLRVASHVSVTAAPEQLAHESQVLTPTDASRLYLRSGAALAAGMAGVALRNGSREKWRHTGGGMPELPQQFWLERRRPRRGGSVTDRAPRTSSGRRDCGMDREMAQRMP